jgi:hypothetical protein
MIGNPELIGGYISQNGNHEKIINFITKKGTFSYNESTDEFKTSPLTPKDPFVLIWNDPWDAQLLSWQI